MPRGIDLSGPWEMTDATGEIACPVSFPGDGITALHQAGLIPDPYWGRNEYDLRWIAERDWLARKSVTLAAPDSVLVIEGLDSICTLKLNGIEIGQTKNAFRRYRFDLSSAARQGENLLEITFHAVTKAANAAQAAQPFYVPYAAGNCPIPNGNMIRKPACDFGWDWNIALAPFGLTGFARIEPKGAVIDRLAIRQCHNQPGRVIVTVEIHSSGATGLPFVASFHGQKVQGVINGAQKDVVFILENPALWWPAGQGEQILHDLTVTIGAVIETRRIGLRRIELVSEADSAGRSFGLKVNGRAIFAKGANWIPADALPGRITPEATHDLLASAVAANMNMIRVWGGGRYEPESFYDSCDALGLMVWQDFMFACNLYPSTPDFLTEVAAEVRDQAARLHHRACLALWCGDNELIGALTWFEESCKDRDRYLVSYDRLNRVIETNLKEVDRYANWWPSSPSPGPMSFGDAWHQDGAGDMHFWSVWHEGRDFDHYRDVSPRFCSEFGFQSYPSMAVIESFTDPKDRNIAAPVFESHQKNAGGNARIAETMFRYFRWPERFADFVWLSQIQQGLAIKTAVTHWRSLKPHCQGTLFWQLNDTWPVCSWSSLDYGGGWKLLHHMAREFYAPVLVTAVPDGAEIVLKAVNDRARPAALTLRAYASALDGSRRLLWDAAHKIAPDQAQEIGRIAQSALARNEILSFDWEVEGQGQSDIYAPAPWKSYDLLPSGLTLDVTRAGSDWLLRLSADALSLFATVEADQPGRFSANAIALHKDQSTEIRFTPKDPEAQPVFILRDLWSATCAQS